MEYFDMDYIIHRDNAVALSNDYEVKDVYFIRKSHYCENTEEYWENKQDESIYLKVKEKDSGIERAILLAKNEVSEYEMYFDDELEKRKFYQKFRNKEFYNHLTIHSILTDKQATQFLDIMLENIDCYDYNFQYCDQNTVIKNIISNNLKNDSVASRYQMYLEKSSNLNQENELDSMLQENKDDKIISFNSKNRK